ncbi:MAG: hypothetical protein ACI86H_000048 [bacterium]|jgi:hypothetical protein
MKKLWLLCYLTLFSSVAFGQYLQPSQVVTPSLDPTFISELGSTGSWRLYHSAGIAYNQGDGSKKYTSSDNKKLADTESFFLGGMAALKGKWFAIEIAGIGENQMKWSSTDASSDSSKIKESGALANVAVLFGDNISIGLQYQSISGEEITSTNTYTYTDNVSGASVSIRLFSSFYLSGGNNKHTLKYDQVNDFSIEWTDAFFGAAIRAGMDGGTQFRLEYAIKRSSEKYRQDATTSLTVHHGDTEQEQIAMELKISDLLLSVSHISATENFEDYLGTSDEDRTIETEADKFGIALIPKERVLLSFYVNQIRRKNIKITSSFNSIKKTEHQSYEFRIGYRF